MNSVLLSIQPQWCELIASGKKTIEVRKTKPKLDTPFKAYIYCTKDEPMYHSGEKFYIKKADEFGNGKVIGEFVCDYITTIFFDSDIRYGEDFPDRCISSIGASCLSLQELKQYANGKDVFGWYISDLVIYDKPRELREFQRDHETEHCGWGECDLCKYGYFDEVDGWLCNNIITRPPQSWCYIAFPRGESL